MTHADSEDLQGSFCREYGIEPNRYVALFQPAITSLADNQASVSRYLVVINHEIAGNFFFALISVPGVKGWLLEDPDDNDIFHLDEFGEILQWCGRQIDNKQKPDR